VIVTKSLYGQDADGNRGKYIYEAELEPDDEWWIKPQIEEQFDPSVKNYRVEQEDEAFGHQFEFEVYIDEWFTTAEITDMLLKYLNE
jgi:hypothetical protein